MIGQYIQHMGLIQLVETFSYYNQPVLFLCKNRKGDTYLSVLTRHDDSVSEWICVEVSKNRLSDIRAGVVGLHEAFKNSENGLLWYVNQSAGRDIYAVDTLYEYCRADELPRPGEHLTKG